MRAVRFYAKHDVRVEEVSAPPEPGPGEVLVRSSLCGICGTDLHEFESGPIFTPREPHVFSGAVLPQILGHEFSGKVVAVGKGVDNVHPGDRVSVQPQIGPRLDYYGQRNLSFLGPKASVVGLNWKWGGMGEYALVHDYNVYRLPDDVTYQQGALVEPTAVAVHAIDRSGLLPGGSVLITGGGPIGALTVLAARAAGITRIFVSEINPGRRDRIAGMAPGLTVLDPTQPDFLDIIRSGTHEGIGVDAAIECAGNARALQTCLKAVRPQGTVVQLGLMGAPAEIDVFELTMRDITLRGSLNYPLTIWPRVFDLMRSGALPAEKVVDDEIAMDDVVEKGFVPLLDRNVCKMKILVSIAP